MLPTTYFEASVSDMTQSSLQSRKRGRSDGDEESRDFTPLSKRINNLHINNGNYNSNNAAPPHEEAHPDSPTGRGPCEASISDNGRSGGGAMAVLQQPLYTPNLTDSDNPYYYEPNKLLYYLYMERMQRSGQSF